MAARATWTRLGRSLSTAAGAPRRRIAALFELQARHDRELEELQRRVAELQREAEERARVLLRRRSEIVGGAAEPTDDEASARALKFVDDIGMDIDALNDFAHGLGLRADAPQPPAADDSDGAADGAAAAAADGGTVRGVPAFWLQALGSHPVIAPSISDADMRALVHLTDVSVATIERAEGALDEADARVARSTHATHVLDISFGFDAARNPCFENEALVKRVWLSGTHPVAARGTHIAWREGQAPPPKATTAAARAGGAARRQRGRRSRAASAPPSFFAFFDTELVTYPESPDEPGILERVRDARMAVAIAQEVVPNGVLWFVGQGESELVGPDGQDELLEALAAREGGA